jgi:hypothetical protein
MIPRAQESEKQTVTIADGALRPKRHVRIVRIVRSDHRSERSALEDRVASGSPGSQRRLRQRLRARYQR